MPAPVPPVRAGVVLLIGALLSAGLTAGCGVQGGAMAYWAGVGRSKKVPAQFQIPAGKVLILVDDPREFVHWPQARDLLATHLGEELLAHRGIQSVVGYESLVTLRQSDEGFAKRGAREVGRQLGADLVLWLEINEFQSPDEIEEVSAAARMSASVRVLNAREEERRDRVRLWPEGSSGHVEQVQLSSTDVNRAGNAGAAALEMARRLAEQIARLFYEHTLGDLDDQRK